MLISLKIKEIDENQQTINAYFNTNRPLPKSELLHFIPNLNYS